MVRFARQRTSLVVLRGLGSGSVIAIALWFGFGQGVATAEPADPSGTSDSSQSEAPSQSEPESTDKSEPDAAPSSADDSVAAKRDARADDADDANQMAAALDEASAADATDAPDTSTGRQRKAAKSTPADDDKAATPDPEDAPDTDSAPDSETPAAKSSAEHDKDTTAVSEPAVTATALAVPAAAPTRRSPVSAQPITVNSMVTDVLTWAGLRRRADGLPVPETPVSAWVQALWLAVRQTQYTLNNQRPTAEVTISGPGPDGLVAGSLNAVDRDDTVLSYTVTATPQHGVVVVDALGNFTYIPGAAGLADQFTITVDDAAGNPLHIHGLLGILGITGPTEVTVRVAATAAVRPASIGVTDLLSRAGVAVTTNPDGTVAVIDGRFIDRVVTSAEDAAVVFNAVAPTLGAAAGFAVPSEIAATQAGVGDSVERFYRLTETIGGVTVLGSDVILVTDAHGAVTSLLNSYLGLVEDFDVTPDASVDTDAEIDLIAGTAYLGSDASPGTLESLLARSTFTTQLFVYAIDDPAAPSLAWQVVLHLPDTPDMTQTGATYLIHADGTDAGDVIVAISNVQDLTAVTVAADWLGQQRSIVVDSSSSFFRKYMLVDATRNIKTYNTSYSLFGFGGPALPGTLVKKGWLGWDKGAVSAHANTAEVYDYYLDVLGRNSYDGKGAAITVSIKYNPTSKSSVGYANAFWDPTIKQFAFGDKGYLQAAVDIIGHEFTHAVVSYVVGGAAGGSVWDHDESGALNEAYADILGTLIEGKSGTDRWLLGEDSDFGAVRNLADPSSISSGYGPYRDNYASRYKGTGDDGGEHVNSTIFSHAAYLMMTDDATIGVSDETWSRVFYQSLQRLTPSALFTNGRTTVLGAAAALNFTTGQLGAIANAFDSVGILGAATSSSIAA